MGYDTAQICKNGHVITSYATQNKDDLEMFCSKCGAETITTCPSCTTPIRGGEIDLWTHDPYDLPSYCHSCGDPFPWTKSAIEALTAIIEEDDQISYEDKSRLTESLPDIVSDNPKTQLAIVRIKKSLKVAGRFTADAIRQFVIDFGSEVVVKQLNQK